MAHLICNTSAEEILLVVAPTPSPNISFLPFTTKFMSPSREEREEKNPLSRVALKQHMCFPPSARFSLCKFDDNVCWGQ